MVCPEPRLYSFSWKLLTSDVVEQLMQGSASLCGHFGARFLLRVHDELVYWYPGTE